MIPHMAWFISCFIDDFKDIFRRWYLNECFISLTVDATQTAMATESVEETTTALKDLSVELPRSSAKSSSDASSDTLICPTTSTTNTDWMFLPTQQISMPRFSFEERRHVHRDKGPWLEKNVLFLVKKWNKNKMCQTIIVTTFEMTLIEKALQHKD